MLKNTRNKLINRCNLLIELYKEYNEEKKLSVVENIKEILEIDAPLTELSVDTLSSILRDLGFSETEIPKVFAKLYDEEN